MEDKSIEEESKQEEAEKDVASSCNAKEQCVELKDVQSSLDSREIELKKVGIKKLHYPITVMDKMQGLQHTVADVSLFVNLPHHFKGTHMSRFVEVFNNYSCNITMKEFMHMLEDMRARLDAQCSYGKIKFPYFIKKAAPVTEQKGYIMYTCAFSGSVVKGGAKNKFKVIAQAPIQTVCPCSKEISEYGAHNQRGRVRVEMEIGSFFWLEDLISLMEESASSPLYSLLKRPDEKYVTEYSYQNPKFVEDVVRDVCIRLPRLGDFPHCSVEAENYESIHSHNAFAASEGYCKAGKFLQR